MCVNYAAARLKNKEKNKENAECVEISTPSGKFSVSVQSSANVKDADGAKKLFKNLASRRYSSPGLVMMKVTSSAKKLAETVRAIVSVKQRSLTLTGLIKLIIRKFFNCC